MRKTILAILCLFLSSTLWAAEPVQLAGAFNVGVVGGQGASAAACTVGTATAIYDQTSVTDGTAYEVGNGGTVGQLIAFSNKTVTHYKMYMKDNGGAGSITMALYTNDGSNHIGSVVADTSKTLTHSDIGASYAVVTFELAAPKTGINGNFWVVATASSGDWPTWGMMHKAKSGESIKIDDYYADFSLSVGVFGCSE
jgi:hypothetical protein